MGGPRCYKYFVPLGLGNVGKQIPRDCVSGPFQRPPRLTTLDSKKTIYGLNEDRNSAGVKPVERLNV